MDDARPVCTENRLRASSSLYLRQHADQPVHWQPWDDDAFDAARAMDRPILLSIGYAACHWCHVMARESFADPATAALMNRLFVCIKVDREERPDLDRFYLAAMAGMGKAAGWPLTAFLAPDATPFDGGGYFPPEPRFGLPSFCDVLRETAAGYRANTGRSGWRPGAATARRAPGGDTEISPVLLDRLARHLADGIDDLYGGFGMDGPKFLHAAGHELLLRAWDRTGEADLLTAAAGSFAHIADGAVFDHVGGGFHRYAVDDRWRVPHFEKMLNDNALMLRLGGHLWQATKGALFKARVEATVGWLLRDMRLPDGAFASSLAADSGDGAGSEGAFYLWTQAELQQALDNGKAGGDGEAALLAAFELAGDERLSGGSALVRRGHGGDWTDDGAAEGALATLRAAREGRCRPLRDDKCLADWNGLAMSALAEAGMIFQRPDWIGAAQAAFAAVLASTAPGPRLAHCAVGGVPSTPGLLDDYAAMAEAALILHEATGDAAFADHALAWESVLEAQFWDGGAGGYFLTASDGEQRIPRQKLIDETSSPAGNGMMLGVLARLYALTGRDRFRHRFEGILRCFAGRMSRAGLQAATALCHSQALERMTQIVIAGRGDGVAPLRLAATDRFLPDRLMIAGGEDGHAPGYAAAGKLPVGGRPAAYVCVGSRCLPPACTAEALAESLSIASRMCP